VFSLMSRRSTSPSMPAWGRPALYQFMAVAHYGYLIQILAPNDVIKICGDRTAGVSSLQKL
jgi:hypothetical protein